MNRITLTILAILLAYIYSYSQCDTPPPDYNSIMTTEQVNQVVGMRRGVAPFTLSIAFHIIRKSDGTDGATVTEIHEELARINAFFAPHEIQFVLDEINEIHNDTYAASFANWFVITRDILYPAHGKRTRIDAFIFNSAVNNVNGNAFSIPSDYFAASERRLNTGNWPHEIGHDLGLIHTHERYGQNCPSNFIENVNGSNCTTAGDLCCDTPADPNLDLANWSLATCTYLDTNLRDCNNDLYSPNVANIMSYGWTCRDHFTTCQKNRMHAELMTGNVGQQLTFNFLASASGDAQINGIASVDRPTTSLGDVGLDIEAMGSAFKTGIKMTYPSNGAQIFALNNFAGGINVANGASNWGPVYASNFTLSISPPNPDKSSIQELTLQPLFELNSLKWHKSSNNASSDALISAIPSSFPFLLSVNLKSPKYKSDKAENEIGVSLNNWTALSNMGIQELEKRKQNQDEMNNTIASSSEKNKLIKEGLLLINEKIKRLKIWLENHNNN